VRVVCSYCRKVIRKDAGSRATDLSHGMCEACAEHFGRLWAGMGLGEYLEGIPHPVVVVEGEGRLVAANRRAGELLGRDPADLLGLLGGEAMACVYSRLPEGCGKTIHCRECTIRNAVQQVARTGKPLERQPAYLKQADGLHPLRISVRPVDELVAVIIEAVDPAQEQVAQA
jgi:PAS domain-containing protein